MNVMHAKRWLPIDPDQGPTAPNVHRHHGHLADEGTGANRA
jgi:hypothetical protein